MGARWGFGGGEEGEDENLMPRFTMNQMITSHDIDQSMHSLYSSSL